MNFMYCTKYSWVAEVPANSDVKRLENGSQHIVYKKERKQEKNHVLRDLKKKKTIFFFTGTFYFCANLFLECM